MLRVYTRYLSVLRSLRPVIVAIERRDRGLKQQLTDAAASVALNLSEGSGSEGGTRRQRHLTALGSAREVAAVLDVAEAFGYAAPPEALVKELNQIIGVLVVLGGRAEAVARFGPRPRGARPRCHRGALRAGRSAQHLESGVVLARACPSRRRCSVR